ncbi:MAG: hypothetical protein ABEJ36_02995 [Candidatus Nanosalina sp.]
MDFEEAMDKVENLDSQEEIEEFLATNPKVQPPSEELPDWEELRRQIRIVVQGFDRYSALKWITATSLIQGNEKYFTRFLFTKFVIATLDEDHFGEKEFRKKEVLQILHKFEDSWALLEDHTVFQNDKQNRIGLDNEQFYFIACENENPETSIESIIRRYTKIDEEFDIFDFSVKKELKKMLRYQSRLIEFLDTNNNYSKIKGFQIPEKAFVEKFEDVWNEVPKFESSLGDSIEKEWISGYNEIRGYVNERPNFENYPLFINLQLEVLIGDIVGELEDNLDRCGEMLSDQLEELVFETLGEIIPVQSIIKDYEVGDKEFEFSFALDNRIVLGKIIPEKNYDEGYRSRVRELLESFEEVKKQIEEEGIQRFGGEKVEKSLEPIFIVILDDIFHKVTFADNRDFTFSILSNNQLSYLSKRMYDDEKPPHFVLKVIEDGQFTGQPQQGDMNIFEMAFAFESGENFPLTEYLENPRKSHYLWKDEERRIHRESMPRIDKRPKFVEEDLSFRMIESEDGKVVHGLSGTMPLHFYCFKEVFCIWNEHSQTDIGSKLASTMAKMCTISIRTAIESLELDLGYQEIFIYTIGQAEELGILSKEQMESSPVAVSNVNEETTIVFDPIRLGESSQDSHIQLFSHILNSILLEEVNDYLPIDMNLQMDFEPLKEFSILAVPYTGDSVSAGHVSPTLFDVMDVEASIHEEFSSDIGSQNYDADEIREILIEVHNFLQEELKQYLEEFSLNSVIKSVFQQLEVINTERKMNQVDLGGYKGSQHLERLINEYKEEDDKLGRHSAASQLLLEKAVLHDISGEKDYGILEHQRALAYAIRISEIASSIAQLRSESEVLDIDVNLDFEDKLGITFESQDGPRSRYMENQAKYLYESNPEDVFVEGYDRNPSRDDLSLSKLDKQIENTALEGINEAFYQDLGFYFNDYVYMVSKISWKDEWKDEVGSLEFKKEDLIEFLNEDSKINRERIIEMLDFFTLQFEEDEDVVKAWKVESRNRVFARPLLKVDDRLLSGLDLLFTSQDRITQAILRGRWIIPGEAPENISEELKNIRRENNKQFEKEVFDEVKSLSDRARHSIAKPNKKGQIFEKGNASPGEIDVLSVHQDEGKIVLWEAKDIEGRIGPRELSYMVKEFIKDEEYIRKLKRKQKFIRENLEKIENELDLEEDRDWDIDSVFVFSEYSYFMELVNEKHQSIPYSDIETYVDKS